MDWGGMRCGGKMWESWNMRLGSKQICIVGQLQSSEVLHKIHASGNVTIFSKLRQIAILFFFTFCISKVFCTWGTESKTNLFSKWKACILQKLMQLARTKPDKWENPAQGKREQNNALASSWEPDRSRRMKEKVT